VSRNHGIRLLLATALALGACAGAGAETESPAPAGTTEAQPEAAKAAGTTDQLPEAAASTGTNDELPDAAPSAETTDERPEAVASAVPMPVGNIADGKTAYAVCAVCHLENAAGRPDGIFPQLASQHASVIYRQISDTRDKRRSNPVMCPFTVTLTDPQAFADLAVYIESLPLPLDNGKGPGVDYAMGAELYERDCAECHGDRGQGNGEELMPMVASQHFAYLERQIEDIAELHRENADSEMVRVAATYSQREREAVADFVSRLEESQQLIPAPEAASE
jgi:cytochrome c553